MVHGTKSAVGNYEAECSLLYDVAVCKIPGSALNIEH